MSSREEMAQRHAQGLAELSELGLALARDLQARALAAPEMAEASDLALAFHRISRSVRQTFALEAKLERDLRRDIDADAERVRKQAAAVRDRRKAQVNAAVERLIWTEAEADDSQRLSSELDDLLEEAALHDDFGSEPLDIHIARICRDLGIAPPVAAGAPREGDPVMRGASP